MRYVIWHTPRTGSNVLCDCLVKSGHAGMNTLNDAGFFIGFGDGVVQAYQEGAVEAYFARNRTRNGVEGCKLGWDYVEHLNYVLPFGEVDRVLGSFDRHILVSRRDIEAQAVSRLIARQTGQWTSLDKRLPVEPVYSRERIDYFIAQTTGYEATIRTWLEQRDTPHLLLEYEDNCKGWDVAMQKIFTYLGIGDIPTMGVFPTLQKQADPLKAEWIARYRRGE